MHLYCESQIFGKTDSIEAAIEPKKTNWTEWKKTNVHTKAESLLV